MFKHPAELLFVIMPTTFAHVLAWAAHVDLILKPVFLLKSLYVERLRNFLISKSYSSLMMIPT